MLSFRIISSCRGDGRQPCPRPSRSMSRASSLAHSSVVQSRTRTMSVRSALSSFRSAIARRRVARGAVAPYSAVGSWSAFLPGFAVLLADGAATFVRGGGSFAPPSALRLRNERGPILPRPVQDLYELVRHDPRLFARSGSRRKTRRNLLRKLLELLDFMVPQGRIELPTSPLPRVRSTTELLRRNRALR